MYIKVSDMNLPGNDKYLVSSTKYVTTETAKKILFPAGSIIFPKNGGAVGTNKKRITTQTTTIDLNTMGVIPGAKLTTQYLYSWFLNFDLMSITSGSALPTISAKNMGEQAIAVPPIELQERFPSFVELIDKSRFIVQSQIKDLQELLDSKMDEYFGGDEE